jgi:hypothetical protein
MNSISHGSKQSRDISLHANQLENRQHTALIGVPAKYTAPQVIGPVGTIYNKNLLFFTLLN